jgi:hypothetical protein
MEFYTTSAAKLSLTGTQAHARSANRMQNTQLWQNSSIFQAICEGGFDCAFFEGIAVAHRFILILAN